MNFVSMLQLQFHTSMIHPSIINHKHIDFVSFCITKANQIHDKRYYTIKVSNNIENVNDYRAMKCILRAKFVNSAHLHVMPYHGNN